ncbi:gpW family protein [Rhodopseudomonas sp. HC1]|uniref:gpW family protein n=1 Tax=Rhodopseudomonas infernalis TaxID=2897386 RepID=UPI001EE98EDE|nr:gpW family protein [Rhodopseudomonas infernalis]MCG6204189.1 gpW family protein [Rhodopseudomonas infernalis]
MVEIVSIDGVEIDFDDPCAVARALRKVELQVSTGGGVVMTRFDDHEVRWSSTNMAQLRDLIANYERQCAVKNGTRTRYAKRMRFV